METTASSERKPLNLGLAGAGQGPGVPTRSLITSNATGGSGYGSNAQGGGGTGAGRGGTLQRGASGKASRSIEEIKPVFERNKGAIYAIYNRALREEPSLQGKLVLELKITPAGQVVDLRIVSSELKAPDLECKLQAWIKQFDFGAKDVDAITVTWPVDFLPSLQRRFRLSHQLDRTSTRHS